MQAFKRGPNPPPPKSEPSRKPVPSVVLPPAPVLPSAPPPNQSCLTKPSKRARRYQRLREREARVRTDVEQPLHPDTTDRKLPSAPQPPEPARVERELGVAGPSGVSLIATKASVGSSLQDLGLRATLTASPSESGAVLESGGELQTGPLGTDSRIRKIADDTPRLEDAPDAWQKVKVFSRKLKRSLSVTNVSIGKPVLKAALSATDVSKNTKDESIPRYKAPKPPGESAWEHPEGKRFPWTFTSPDHMPASLGKFFKGQPELAVVPEEPVQKPDDPKGGKEPPPGKSGDKGEAQAIRDAKMGQHVRNRPDYKGDSTYLTSALAQVVESSKPIKSNRPKDIPIAPQISRRKRRALRQCVIGADEELVDLLRLEALLQPRTPELMLRLKGKAMRYLDKFDMTAITAARRFTMVTTAVTTAMIISPDEDKVRQTLKSPEQQMLREKGSRFAAGGVIGHSGWNRNLRTLPNKAK